ncbi:hypothetical protein ACFL5S_00525 [Fibrobacterota bacterium]
MTLLFVILLLAALTISLFVLIRSNLTTTKKVVLMLNRLLIVAVLLLAFFQPSFKITRLSSQENVVPVLIDLSSSMQLFNTDSALTSFIRLSSSSQYDKGLALPTFKFFGFGDSLRPIKDLKSIAFNDKNSVFPRFFNDPHIKNCSKIILFSDGNWYNTVSETNMIHEKECFYTSLQQVLHPSYIHVEAPNSIKSTVKEPLVETPVVLSGYNKKDDPVFVTFRMGERIIAEKKLQADTGFFTETISIPVTTKRVGSHLLELRAKLRDTISSNRYILHEVTPSNFSAHLYSSRPSLDRRFLSLAFNRKANWEIIKDISARKEKTDLLILFSWDKQAQLLFRNNTKSSVVFVGCLPSEKVQIHNVSLFKPTVSHDFRHIFRSTADSDFPPLSEFTFSRSAPFTVQRVLISLDSIPAENNPDYSGYPLLFEALFKGRLILAFAAKGLWRWDFWPKSLDASADTKFFTDFLIDRMQALVKYNTNQTFYIYPDISPIYETDSLSFKIALPSYLYNFPSVKANFSIATVNGDTLFDSTFNLIPFQTHSLSLKTPPLNRGKYTYSCTIVTKKGALSYSDSIAIYTDNSELRVLGQNTIMLKEIANPVSLSDTAAANTFLTGRKGTAYKGNETITRTVKINRSWLMITFLLILFGVEWVLRRAWRLD